MTAGSAQTSAEAADHALIWLLRRNSTTECTGFRLSFCGYRADRASQGPADTLVCCKAASPCAWPTCVAEEASDPCVPRAPLGRLRCGRSAEAMPFRWCTMSRNLQGNNSRFRCQAPCAAVQGRRLQRLAHFRWNLIWLCLWSTAWRPQHRSALSQQVQQLRRLDEEGCRIIEVRCTGHLCQQAAFGLNVSKIRATS